MLILTRRVNPFLNFFRLDSGLFVLIQIIIILWFLSESLFSNSYQPCVISKKLKRQFLKIFLCHVLCLTLLRRIVFCKNRD